MRPKGFEDVPELSPEEVQRRVEVQGGGAPPAPIERPSRERGVPPPPPKERTVARNSLLVIVLVVVGLVAVRFLLPEGPLTATSTSQPSGTAAALASVAPTTIGPIATPNIQTLQPGPTQSLGSQTPSPTPTAAPGPTPTRRPSSTPRPTPRPTKTPTPTLNATAHLLVRVVVVTDGGGDAPASSWTVSVTSAGAAIPASFPGSTGGTPVTISAGATYSVSSSGPTGYAQILSDDCSSSTGGLPVAGATETCTVTQDDIKPKVTVYTIVNSEGDPTPATAAEWDVTVTGTVVSPEGTFPGSSSGLDFRFNANAPFSVAQVNDDPDYQQGPDDPDCSSAGEAPGAVLSCTFTFTYVPPTAPAVPAGWIVPIVAAAGLRGRRAWMTRRRR